MKKSLLAVAAIGAFASAAQAQSSVTVYGILDAGLVGESARVATGSAVTKTTGNGFGSSAESTSRLGFKGTEDLGGGTSAFFTVELGLTPNNSFVVATSATQNRQTFVGLKKNGIGDFAFGTQYTVVHNAVAATDPGQLNNVAGNLVYTGATTTVGGNPSSSSSFGGGNGTAAGDGYTIRANNMLTLNSDTFAGFKAHGMVIANNTNSTETTTTGGINNYNGWGLGADYTWNKLFVTADYQALTAKNLAGNTGYAGGPTIFGAGQGSVPGLNVKDNQFYAAATYDFGILKAYAQYVNRKATSQIDPLSYVNRSAEQIGVRSYVTSTVEVWANGGLGRYTAFGDGAPTANLTAWQLGSNYWLSKRTNLYAIYGQQGTSNVNTGTLFTANPASYNLSNYAVGVRHTF
jgi:predicted porin